MAVIRPFRALRPALEVAEQVASVPYDVVNTDEARELAGGNPLSFLRITRSEIEFPNTQDPYATEIYTSAKENLEKIRSAAPLIEEEDASFYLYRLTMDGRSQTGIAATFSVDDYDNDIILKHEKTRKVKEDDRTNHIITTGAQTGVVFLTYKGVTGINALVHAVIKSTEPLYDFTTPDGIRHEVWQVPLDNNGTIIEEIRKVKNLYIADGHHRAASASRARAVAKENNPAHRGSEDYNFFIAVLFPAEELKILPYNRVVIDLNGNTTSQFFDKVKEHFEVSENGIPSPAAKGEFSMYIEGKWYGLKLKPEHYENGELKGAETVGDTLDVSILQNWLLEPVLGVDDPRTSKRIDFIGGIRGTGELEKLVNSGKWGVAFSLYPVTVEDLMKISDAGEVMPPKSTWFEPKLRDGLLTHLIEIE
ncbi:MAG: hypothetical protein HBSAPP04_09570 [Ignavibacteriaceae bacterium]|nr:MAG: hypothetical protein HBSAPP04_09570 [Ignavibacteriaceae bacterium]